MTQNSINSAKNILQFVSTSTASVVTCSTTIPADDTIPQNTKGTEVLTLSITPTYSTSTFVIIFSGQITKDTTQAVTTTALFQDSTANALSTSFRNISASGSATGYLRHIMTSGTTSSTTFKIRVGSASTTCYVNGNNAGTRRMGGVSNTTLTIIEYN